MNWGDVINFANNGNPKPPRRDERSEEEWRELLAPERFYITRLKGTESPHSSEMCSLFTPGRYACGCCGTELFDSSSKFESGTGWPSFTEPVDEDHVLAIRDTSYGMVRIETRCARCDSHQGHVFPDGPPPTRLRYCINSVSLEFVANGDPLRDPLHRGDNAVLAGAKA